jgi:hypothetical protein
MQALPPPPPPVAAPPLDRSEATTGDLRVAAALTEAQVQGVAAILNEAADKVEQA